MAATLRLLATILHWDLDFFSFLGGVNHEQQTCGRAVKLTLEGENRLRQQQKLENIHKWLLTPPPSTHTQTQSNPPETKLNNTSCQMLPHEKEPKGGKNVILVREK